MRISVRSGVTGKGKATACLYCEPQRQTAGCSASAATQPPGISPDRLFREAAPSSPFKEAGEGIYLQDSFLSLVSLVHRTGSSFPQIPGHATQLPH